MTERRTNLLEQVKIYHGNQVRKYTGEPYWHHTLAVANSVDHLHPQAWEIALLHDVDEDTQFTIDDISRDLRLFGYTVNENMFITDGVISLTDVYTHEDFPDYSREDRKEMENKRLSTIPSLHQSIKYADLIDNTKSIAEHDVNFAQVYLKEKKKLLSVMRMGDFDLFLEAIYLWRINSEKVKGLIKIKNVKPNVGFFYRNGFMYRIKEKRNDRVIVIEGYHNPEQIIEVTDRNLYVRAFSDE